MDNRLIDLIEQLEDILDHAGKVPLTGKVIVDEDLILEIVDGIRNVLPEEIRQANLILAERDRMMEDARAEGSRIVERAQRQAEQLLDENNIVNQSRAYSEDLVRKAQQYSKEVKIGALKYSDELLRQVEQKLEESHKAIRANREEMSTIYRKEEPGK